MPACKLTGEKLEVVKKQLKVHKKQQQKATPAKESPKKALKNKGIRIRKGVRIRVHHPRLLVLLRTSELPLLLPMEIPCYRAPRQFRASKELRHVRLFPVGEVQDFSILTSVWHRASR